jgi:hypothetical protein
MRAGVGRPYGRRMTLRARIHRWHSPSLFTLIALCFLLPFATVFANGCESRVHSSTRFTGVQLVTHTVPRGGKDPGCSRDISVCVERTGATTAQVAFGAAIVGLLLGLLDVARGAGWCASVGLGALAALFVNLATLPADDFSLHAGYWLALLLFFWAGLVHLRRAAKRARARGRPTEPVLLWGRPPISQPPSEGEPNV